MNFVIDFNEINKDSIPYVGGKGANLGELARAGFPVPQGFCVSTEAYQAFLSTTDRMDYFFMELGKLSADNLDGIRRTGQCVRKHLETLPIPSTIETAIVDAWEQHDNTKAYAVRSSATAEDLPGASFAGQQETFLNVVGKSELLNAVRRCWSSLFTDRAISYRIRNGFDHRHVSLAVVIQEMIFPEVSGIMFTADPISGNRRITSIDASFGLGEALVSGLVSADLYQVRDHQIIQKKISTKKLAVYDLPGGGTVTEDLSSEQQSAQALPDERIVELTVIGKKIESHYGSEQDIEWCLADGKFYIVQSRPITTLYPVPSFSDGHLHILVSVGHIQMMTDAMKPMASSIFVSLIPIAVESGGRVFGDLTPLLSVKFLRRRIPLVLQRMDEQLTAALEAVVQRPTTKLPRRHIPLRMMSSIAFPALKTVVHNILLGDLVARRAYVNRYIEESVKTCRQTVVTPGPNGRIAAIKGDMREHMPPALLTVAPNWISGELVSEVIKKLLQRWLRDTESMFILQRSLPGNVTSELGLMIGDIADSARHNQDLLAYLEQAADDTFFAGLDAIRNSETFRTKFDEFLQQFGMRCPGEIDISKPRWHETPTTLVPAIMSHIRTMAPGEHRVKFQQAFQEAERAANQLVDRVRQEKGLLRARILRRLIYVYRNLGGLREHHKYMLIQHLDIYRQTILEEGQKLFASGRIGSSSDVFFLTLNELQAIELKEFQGDIGQLITERKRQYALNQKLTPPRVMTSEGEIITSRPHDDHTPDGALHGTPVSAGVVEGYAKVVLRPEDATLTAGEIMIAPFTDPGWTPLFHSARALVMEVGGMMTHGAVVAREYGIPAVVGINHATRIIKNGSLIRVDGTKGYVQVLQEPIPSNSM